MALELSADLAAEDTDGAHVEAVRAALREGLEDADPVVAAAAARGMILWAEPKDATTLVRLAARSDESLSRASGDALAGLAQRTPEAVRSALEGAILDGAAGVALAPVVARLGGARALDTLQAGLSADEAEARRAAIEGLADLGSDTAAELIAFALTDEDPAVQVAAAHALGRLRDADGGNPGTPALLLALESGAPAVKAAAARALGEAQEMRALEPLRELSRDPGPGVAVAAMTALRALHDPVLGDLLVEALGHGDEEVVKQALRAIHEGEATARPRGWRWPSLIPPGTCARWRRGSWARSAGTSPVARSRIAARPKWTTWSPRRSTRPWARLGDLPSAPAVR